MLEQVAGLHEVPQGAYSLRVNGDLYGKKSSENIDIVKKEDKPGIDIYIKPGTKKESLHIPVLLSQSGLKEVVYNDFHIGEDCDVTIVAGCGIHNGGSEESEHSGIHSFYLEKGAKLTTKKSVAAKEIILQHSKDFGGTLTDKEVCTLAKISRNSFYKYKSELKMEGLNKK